jgi:hypothetical protein
MQEESRCRWKRSSSNGKERAGVLFAHLEKMKTNVRAMKMEKLKMKMIQSKFGTEPQCTCLKKPNVFIVSAVIESITCV